ncbi:unnamed protein product [Trifolium pratense]|uniref:Uncharacterized protein n=1 Tax=Trifolium pratense TaxID=57577 RepID=A0ACB0IRE1_TRIPR|nr:unnamed protein product [Trifolium pratense]
MRRREEVTAMDGAELCGGRAVASGPVEEGASAGGIEEEEEVSVTLTLNFWPLVQCPDKVQLK